MKHCWRKRSTFPGKFPGPATRGLKTNVTVWCSSEVLILNDAFE